MSITPDGSNSRRSTDGPVLRWEECFKAAIQHFHNHIDKTVHDHAENGTHPTRPRTARGYFRNRGWSDETIETQLLGWAPGDDNDLASHLKEDGYSKVEMLATGLFTEDLEPLWRGRYVFPYLNGDGQPVYAIARTAGGEGHPNDFLSGKYARLAHTKDYARVSEPIFGLESIRMGEPVIITEGIADAITVQQAGYPCVSPVTTRFKHDDRKNLLTVLKVHNVPCVYVLQDAERPSVAVGEEQEKLEIEQFGPGITGAVETAAFLSENGMDARVNTPPRRGLRKVDVDDYLRDDWGTLAFLLRSAKPARQHPAYTEIEEGGSEPSKERKPSVQANSEGKSAVFCLDITDVTGLSVNFRGKSPLGHMGESENYFLVHDQEWAYDHKRTVGYNPLTYILCEAGERPVNNPTGPLSDEEQLVVWKHAKECGLLPKDDPIPHRGLVYIALEHGLCEQDEIQDGWRLPLDAYNMALDVVRDEYGLDPGRDAYESTNPTENLSRCPVIPDDEPATAEITIEDARQRCKETIGGALAHSQYSLIDALPAQGKSRGVIEWAAQTGNSLTVLAPRHDLHDQSREWCAEFGLEYYSLPAFHTDCGCANGEYGKALQKKVWSLYNAGATGREIHEYSERRFGKPLPCQENGRCLFLRKWDFDPDDFDVLLGHYTHAYRDKIVEERVLAIDETPTDAYLQKFEHTEVVSAVTHYLQQHDGIPFENYADLTEHRTDPYRSEAAFEWFQENGNGVNRDGYSVITDRTGEAHALAPYMTYALLVGEELGNGWEHATLSEGQVTARNCAPSEEHGEKELSLLLPPSLDEAESVVGLDGTPWLTQWELCLGTSLTHYPVLNDDERTGYLCGSDGLDLTIYQTTEAAKPYSGGRNITPDNDAALFKLIGERECRLPDLISSQKAIEMYKNNDGIDFVGKTGYYGNLKGTNDFKESRLGIVAGSPHYGDTYLEMWGALAGERVERRNDSSETDLDYGPFGNEILHSMRENEVLQALMRFGRDGDGATVYVNTGALPEWVPLAGKGQVVKWSEGMRQLLSVVRDCDEWGTSDLLTQTDGKRVLDTDAPNPISERQIRRNLDKLNEYGFLDKRKEGCGWLWQNTNLSEVKNDRQLMFKQ